MAAALPLRAQTLVDNYRVSTGVAASTWIDITGQDTLLMATQASTISAGRSVFNDIGFAFPFADTSYTQFSVNIEGLIRLDGSSDALFPNWQNNPLTQTGSMPLINPFGVRFQMDTTCYVRCATVGGSGNRVLVVEMRLKVYEVNGAYVSGQVQLHEATGAVRIVYGTAHGSSQMASQPGLARTAGDILFIDHATHSVRRLTCTPVPTNAAGVWPEEGRYYSFVPQPSACPFPPAISMLGNHPDSVVLTWSGVTGGTAWRLSLPTAAIDILLTDTVVTLGGMEPNTAYSVALQRLCGGDTSLGRRLFSFTTSCGTVHRLPWSDGFQTTATSDCWLTPYKTSGARWQRQSASNNYYMRTGYNTAGYNEWLISPPVVLPDTIGLTLGWWYKSEKAGSIAPKVRVRLLVCDTTDEVDTTAAWVTLDVLEDYEQNFQQHYLSLDAYAGHRVRVAFQRYGTGGRYTYIDNVGVELRLQPTVSLEAPARAYAGDTTVVPARLMAGVPSNPQYSWFSTMEDHSQAMIVTSYNDTLRMVYLADGLDTVTFTLTTDYGTATQTVVIEVVDCRPVTVYPWHDGFEHGLDCWTQTGNSAWTLGNSSTNYEHSGEYCIRSNTSSHSNLIVSQPVVVPADAFMLRLGFWGKLSTSSATATGTILVRIGDESTTDWTNATVLGTATVGARYTWVDFPLDAYAGQTVRFALHHTQSNKTVFVDDIAIRYTRELVGSMSVSSARVDEGDTVTATVTLEEGDTTGITYIWNSTMAWHGLATIIGNGPQVNFAYSGAGVDTIDVIITNAWGTIHDTVVVQVCPVVESLPWVVDYQNDLPCWQVLAGGLSASASGFTTTDWNAAIVSPAVELPNDNGMVFEFQMGYYGFYGTMYVMATTGDNLGSWASYDTLATYPLTEAAHARLPLNAYAGQRVHFAFKVEGQSLIFLTNMSVRYAWEPVIELTAGGEWFPGTSLDLTATLLEGLNENLVYTWTSTMTERGDAIITSDSNTATLTCFASGVDTVKVVVSNAYGSDSAWATTTIKACDTVGTFPWLEDFGDSLSCWWQPEGSLWAMPEDGSDGAAMAVNLWEAHDSWLVSRPIALPDNIQSDEGEGLQLWWDAASEWQNHHSYCVLVSTAADYRDTSAYDTLRAIDRNHTFRSNGWDTMHVDLSAYADQTIHLAFRYTTEYYEPSGFPGVLLIDNVRIIDSRPPEVKVWSPARSFVDDTAVYSATVMHGVRSSMSYTWQSSMEEQGLATAWSDDSLFYVIPLVAGWDTISLVATNAYGSDTVCFRQYVYNCPAVTVPWQEDFEGDFTCWVGSWTLTQVTYLATDSSSNVIHSTPNSWYASPWIDLPDTVGLQLMWHKWVNANSNLMKIFVSPTGSIDPADFTDTLLYRQTGQGYDSVSLDAYAGRRIRVAFAQAASSDYSDSYYLDDIRVDYNRAVPQVILTAPSNAAMGDTVTAVATLGNNAIGVTYSWSSTLGTVTAAGAQCRVSYAATGIDTLRVVATNAFGSDTATAVVEVVDSAIVAQLPVVQIAGPSTVDVLDTVTYTATLLQGDTAGLSYSWSSVVGGWWSVVSGQLSVVYQTPCVDTLMLVATNGYGADTAVRVVNVQWPAAWLPQAELVTEPYYYSCDTAVATLRWLAGDTTGRTLTLLSSMAATVTVSDSTARIVYASGGTDTLWLIAANAYGADTVSVTVPVRNCGVATAMPYFSFPGGNNNDFDCWKTWSFNTSLRAAHNPTYDPAVWRKGWDDYNGQHKQVSSSVQNAGLYGDTAIRPDSWLLSPMVALPANADTITLRWNTACHSTTYYLMVSTTGRTAPRNYTDTVLVETVPDGSYHTPWSSRSLSLSQYAGQTISLAFHHTGPIAYNHDGRVAIDSIRIECIYLPAPPPPDTVWRTVTVHSADSTMGSVIGGGPCMDSTTVTIRAIALQGYEFVAWNDGDTLNPRQVFVVSDTAFTALFREVEDSVGINELSILNSHFSIYPNPASMSVTVEVAQPDVLTLLDVSGREVLRKRLSVGGTRVDISALPQGVYFVRLGGSTLVKKLIVR